MIGLLAAPLFVAASLGAMWVRGLALAVLAPVSVPALVALAVATQAGATLAAVAVWMWAAEATGSRPSLFLVALFSAVGAYVVWRWYDEAEWERTTGWIAAPDDEEARWRDAVGEVEARAVAIGTAAGFLISAVTFRALPLL